LKIEGFPYPKTQDTQFLLKCGAGKNQLLIRHHCIFHDPGPVFFWKTHTVTINKSTVFSLSQFPTVPVAVADIVEIILKIFRVKR